MSKLKIETLWSFATKGITFILFFSSNIFLARVLGPEKFGLWNFFFGIATIIFTISYFGINVSSKSFIAKYNGKIELKNIIKASINLRFIFSLGFSLLVLLFYPLFINIINKPELNNLFIYLVPLTFLSGFVEIFKEIFIGFHNIKYNFIINVCEYILKFFLVIFFFLFSSQLINIIQSYLIAMIISTIVGFYLLYYNFYKDLENECDKKFYKKILTYSVPLFFITVGTAEIDIIILGFLSTSREVGIYSIAKQLIMMFPHISLAIAIGTMQIFAKLNKENKNELRLFFNKLLKINGLIFFVLTIFIFFGSYIFVPLIYGDKYKDSIVIFQVLSPYMLMASFSVFFSFLLDYQGLAKKRAYNLFISLILNIILSYFLIIKYGAFGAGLATTISAIPYFILNIIETRKLFK